MQYCSCSSSQKGSMLAAIHHIITTADSRKVALNSYFFVYHKNLFDFSFSDTYWLNKLWILFLLPGIIGLWGHTLWCIGRGPLPDLAGTVSRMKVFLRYCHTVCFLFFDQNTFTAHGFVYLRDLRSIRTKRQSTRDCAAVSRFRGWSRSFSCSLCCFWKHLNVQLT